MSDDVSSLYRVAFDQLAWEIVAQGMRQKVFDQQEVRLRIVEYGRDFKESDWCIRGHVGYVIEGEMQIDFDGQITTVRADEAILIPAGRRHRHHATVQPTTLFLVEQK